MNRWIKTLKLYIYILKNHPFVHSTLLSVRSGSSLQKHLKILSFLQLTSSSFISALGGALSLFLGISISMLFEIFEFLFDLIMNICIYLSKGGPKKEKIWLYLDYILLKLYVTPPNMYSIWKYIIVFLKKQDD